MGITGTNSALSAVFGDSNALSFIALIVSVLALIATIGQLLQQYVSTADGYRRCQSSVMGPWGRKTRLRWLWRQFRFECLFSVPSITYVPIEMHDGRRYVRAFCKEPCLTTFNPNIADGELVGWVYMLHYLGQHDQGVRQKASSSLAMASRLAFNDYLRCASITITPRSWDFVPDDVVRPLAMTTLGGLAATTRRLGMAWKQWEPCTGGLQAEGNHQVLTSTVIRGMGVIIHYLRDPIIDSDEFSQLVLHRTSPLSQGDDLQFGRMGHSYVFNVHYALPHLWLHLATFADVAATFPVLFSDPVAADQFIASLRTLSDAVNKDWMMSANDIIPFLSPFLGLVTYERPIIPWPNTSARGLTYTAFRPFEAELIALVNRRGNTPPHMAGVVLGFYQALSSRFPSVSGHTPHLCWEIPSPTFKKDMYAGEPGAIRTLFEVFIECESLLQDTQVVKAAMYHHLIAQHLLACSRLPSEATDTEKMRRLFEALPNIAQGVLEQWNEIAVSDSVVEQKGVMVRPSNIDVQDAWLIMVLRAMCWQRLHVVAPGPSLSTEYADSKLPVYIT